MLPVSDFFKYAETSGFRISPDGKFISYLKTFKTTRNIFIRELATGRETRITSHVRDNVSRYSWADNDHILYLKDSSGDEHYHLFEVEINEKKSSDLTPYPGVNIEWVELSRSFKKFFFFGMNKRRKDLIDIYSLEIKTGAISMLINNPGKTQYMMFNTDNAGILRVFVASDGETQQLMYRPDENSPFKPIISSRSDVRVEPLAFSNDNRFLYASSNLNRDKSAIVKIDPLTGQEIEVVYENPEVDVRELTYSFMKDRPVYTSFVTDQRQEKILDTGEFAWFAKIKKDFPGQEVQEISADDLEDKFLIRTYSDVTQGSCYLFERSKGELKKIAELSPWIDPSSMCHMKPVTYRSRDGLLIHAYLTLPIFSGTTNLPFIVLPHPGPFMRDNWTFNPEVQFFANRGYGVLQLNYRGSIGYGKKFMEASYQQWGKKIQDDIDDGTKWLIAKNLADPKRISIYGLGFGGYCALSAAVRKPDLYACSISCSGMVNLFDYAQSIGPQYVAAVQRMHQYLGNPEKDVDYFRSASPLFHTDQIKIPVFIAQGAKYNRVNLKETRKFINELKRKGNKVELLVEQNEGYLFRREENRLEFYKQTEDFLEANLQKR